MQIKIRIFFYVRPQVWDDPVPETDPDLKYKYFQAEILYDTADSGI